MGTLMLGWGLKAQYTSIDIPTLRTIDSSGNYLYKDSMVSVKAIVHSINFKGPNRLFFTIQNTNGDGIWIYKNNVSGVGYIPSMGDSIEVRGEVTVFRQLLEINPDTIILIDSAQPLNTPQVVTTFNEMYEAELLKVNCVWMDSNTSWGNGSFNMTFTNGTNSFVVRIENTVRSLFTTPPTHGDTFSIVGVLGQYSNNDPWSGYQLYPRDTSDFIPCGSSGGGGGTGPTYMPMTIAQARTIATDSAGNPYYMYEDSLVVLTGVAHTQNFRGGYKGLFFTIEDSTAGIWVYHNNDSFGYSVAPGDKYMIWGQLTAYHNLLEIIPDSMVRISTGNALNPADTVTWAWSNGTMFETYEGQLVVLTHIWLADTSQWIGGNSFVFNVDAINANGDTFTLRIDNNAADLHSSPPITDTFNVRGALGQYTLYGGFYNGYQLFPRGLYDITILTTTGVQARNHPIGTVSIYPNPTSGIAWLTGQYARVELLTPTGQIVFRRRTASDLTLIDLSDQPAGLYIIRATGPDGTTHYGRIIKR